MTMQTNRCQIDATGIATNKALELNLSKEITLINYVTSKLYTNFKTVKENFSFEKSLL